MSEVLAGKCSDAQIAALLIALRMKGETVEEIVGFAEAIRAAAAPLPIRGADALAVTGTGRDALSEESLGRTPAAPAATPAARSTSPPRRRS